MVSLTESGLLYRVLTALTWEAVLDSVVVNQLAGALQNVLQHRRALMGTCTDIRLKEGATCSACSLKRHAETLLIPTWAGRH